MDVMILVCFFSAFFSLAALLFLGLIAYAVLSRGAQETAWRELAARSGLVYEGGGFLKRAGLRGVYRGRQVIVDIHSHHGGYQAGSGSYPYTRLRLALEASAGAKLVVREKRLLPTFIRASSPSGDPAIDSRYSIISQPAELAARLFKNASLRDRIMAARSFDLEIDGAQLCFEARGVEKDVDYLVSLLDLLSDIARLVEDHVG